MAGNLGARSIVQETYETYLKDEKLKPWDKYVEEEKLQPWATSNARL